MLRTILLTCAIGLASGAVAANDEPPRVTQLKKLLASTNSKPRQSALAELAKLGPAAASARPDVEPLLKAESLDERLAAAAALVRFGADEKRYDELLTETRSSLKAKDAGPRASALRALQLLGAQGKGEYGAGIASLFSSCEGPGTLPEKARTAPFAAFADQTVVRAITDAFGPPPKECVPLLVGALADTDPQTRFVADCLLWQAIQAGHAGTAEPFVPLLRHKEAHARLAAVKALARCETVPVAALPAVAEVVADPGTRPYAIEILVRSGPASQSHLPAIRKALAADSVAEAWAAARIDPDGNGPVAAKVLAARLDELAKQPVAGLLEARRLCRMLEALGPLAKDAVPALGRWLTNESVRRDAAAALVAVGSAAVPELRAALRGPKPGPLHVVAVSCLQELGSEARAAVPELVALLNSDYTPGGFFSSRLGDEALSALAAIGPDGATPEAIGVLKARLQKKEINLDTLDTFMVLGAFGAKAKELAPDLAKIVTRPAAKDDAGANEVDDFLRLMALASLIAVDPAHSAVREGAARLEKKGIAGLDLLDLLMFVDGLAGFTGRWAGAAPSALAHFSSVHEPVRKLLREGLDKPVGTANADAAKFSGDDAVRLAAALARANPKDVPLALRVFEHALNTPTYGAERALVELARLGPAASALTPAVKRFRDRQPAGIACVGEIPEAVPGRGGFMGGGMKGGCMFCAPSRSTGSVAAPGLVVPQEPFTPGSLHVPLYASLRTRNLATDTLSKIAPKP